jgi:hypothetical protein
MRSGRLDVGSIVDGVTPNFVAVCEVFQPAEKACWEILLRARPDAARIPAAALQGAMERTLEQLWSLLRARSVDEWMRGTPAGPLPPWLPSGCALEQLLAFFGSGQRAVELTMAEIERKFPHSTSEQRTRRLIELRLAFNVLVQRGLDRLCGDCPEHERCTLSGRHRFGTTIEAVERGRRKRARSSPRISMRAPRQKRTAQPVC